MPRAANITSSANPLVKDVRRAAQRGGLTAEGWCVAESFHLLEEALRDDLVRHVLAAESARAGVETRLERHHMVPLAVLPDALFRTVSATETSQGVVALVKLPGWRQEQLFGSVALIVVLDGLQDPGNAGAIVRAAEAFGATGVVFLKGVVSPFNPKTLRASAGSLFRVPFVHGMEPSDVVEVLGKHDVAMFAAVTGEGEEWAGQGASPSALIIGSESRGVSPSLRSVSTAITIPTAGVESLNASLAAGILLYEASRQRSGRR